MNILLQVALARHFRAPIRMPENVIVDVVIVTKKEGGLLHRVIAEQLTAEYDDLGLKCERDAFDTLFDHAPDKLQVYFFMYYLVQIIISGEIKLRYVHLMHIFYSMMQYFLF